MRIAGIVLVVTGLLAAGRAATHRAEELRPRDPPVPIDAAVSAREAEAIVAEAVARGWHVDQRLTVRVRSGGSWTVLSPSVVLEGIHQGTCVAAVASVSGMIVTEEIHFDSIDLHPPEGLPWSARGCGWVEYHAPPPPRAVVSATTCYEETWQQVRYEVHVSAGPLWADEEARPDGTIALVLLRADHVDVATERARDLPEGAPIERDERPRGERSVSTPGALRRGGIVLAVWWGIGGALLAVSRGLLAWRRRRREAIEAIDRRTVRRLTVVVPRSMRSELEEILADRDASDHARLERARNRLITRSSEIAALGLARWRGPSERARALTNGLERDLDAIDTRAAGYRGAPGDLVALTIVLRHAGETMGYDLTLDRIGVESALRATVPPAPEELESLAWRWTPRDPSAGLDLQGLDEVMHGLLRVDGAELVECEACGAARARAVERCACATSS